MVLEGEIFGEFQDWCLRTYGDSGKTKTVTRRKYNKILQTLSHTDESDPVYIESNHINAKFKFWVKSKGFLVGTIQGDLNKNGAADRPVLYVPIKATVSKCSSFLTVRVNVCAHYDDAHIFLCKYVYGVLLLLYDNFPWPFDPVRSHCHGSGSAKVPCAQRSYYYPVRANSIA